MSGWASESARQVLSGTSPHDSPSFEQKATLTQLKGPVHVSRRRKSRVSQASRPRRLPEPLEWLLADPDRVRQLASALFDRFDERGRQHIETLRLAERAAAVTRGTHDEARAKALRDEATALAFAFVTDVVALLRRAR